MLDNVSTASLVRMVVPPLAAPKILGLRLAGLQQLSRQQVHVALSTLLQYWRL